MQLGEDYIVWSGKFLPFQFSLWMFIVDMEGELVNEMLPGTPDSISEQAGNILVLNDTMLVGMSHQRVLSQSSSTQGDMVLTCISPEGQVYWRQAYGLADRAETPLRTIRCSDGGFAIVGQVVIGTSPNDNGEVILVKTDSSGNQLWERTYGGWLYDSGEDIIQTIDGGFLLLGWTRSYGEGERDFYLIKTDSIGDFQWERTYGGAGSESGANIISLTNGNYLLSGGGTDDGVTSKGQLYEVIPDGDVVWHEKYASGPMPKGYIYRSVQLPNGSIVSCGLAENSDTGGNAGWILKTSSTGELLWQRVFDKNEYTDLFYTMLATEDDGFLLGGQAVNAETMSQDAWLLKVDSVGCAYPNCITGLDELEGVKPMVDVWPNPTTEFFNFEVQGSSTSLVVTATDMRGSVFSPSIDGGSINVRDWPNGLYVLSFIDGNRKASVKVVVQH